MHVKENVTLRAMMRVETSPDESRRVLMLGDEGVMERRAACYSAESARLVRAKLEREGV